MEYDNTNTGLLSKNDRKELETHSDYKGSINVEGREYWLDAFIKEGREGTKMEGKKYFRLKLRPKDAPAAKPAPQKRRSDDDDIPF